MNVIKNISRRELLRDGLCILLGYGFPLHGNANFSAVPGLMAILAKHRWLISSSRFSSDITQAPLILQTQEGPINNPLLFWMEKNLDLVKKYRLNPLRATRTFSYVSVAIHDAVVSCIEKYGDSPHHSASAASLAAGKVIEHLFSEEVKGRWTGESIMIASAYASRIASDWNDLWRLSQEVSQQVIHRALTDGSARINALAQPPKTIQLAWKATPPLWSTRPTEPGAASWRHWLVPSLVGDDCPPPLTLHEERYLKEVEEVLRTHQNLTPEQKEVAESWNLDLGTVTPPGVWILKAIEKTAFKNLALVEQTGLLSLLSTVMMDAFTACWYVKFKWWTERPITAIRRLYDPNFLPHVLTPSFPSYPSGHATVSGVAATILSNLLPDSQDEWQKAAQEAAKSRLYGGIHFDFDNSEGLALGQKVGQLAIAGLRNPA